MHPSVSLGRRVRIGPGEGKRGKCGEDINTSQPYARRCITQKGPRKHITNYSGLTSTTVDKIYFCGGLKLLRFERFGADVQLDGEGYAKEFDALDFEKPWVTDHLGVTATFDVVD